MLLANVFEKSINACLEYYGLDRYHCFSSPGLSWDNLGQLELVSDIDMRLFIQKGIRRGTSYIAKRHSRANNIIKYVKCYDSSKESEFVMYLEANNLYGWARS